jgi:hypothetical protein
MQTETQYVFPNPDLDQSHQTSIKINNHTVSTPWRPSYNSDAHGQIMYDVSHI